MVSILFLANCSSTQLIYKLVENFFLEEVSYFVDLDEEENVLLKQQVSEMVLWHRTYMMPSYASYLEDIANNLEVGKYDTLVITKVLSNGRILIEKTVKGLTPFASKFLIQHQTIEDIKFIEKQMGTRRQERLEELSKPMDILYEKRLKRLTSNFERFFGTLSDEQVILLKAYASATFDASKIRLNNRTQRQKVFLEFLKTKPTEAMLTNYLNKLLLRGYLITNPGYKTFSDTSLNRFQSLLVDMLAISSNIQRETIISTLRKYANDFKAVSS